MPTHVYPVGDVLNHKLVGTDCSCDPEVEYADPSSGMPYADGPLVIHKDVNGRMHDITETVTEETTK